MLVIADSGSTKTTWVILHEGNPGIYLNTGGLNPFFTSEKDIINEISQSGLSPYQNRIKKIVFYGAGIIDDTAVRKIQIVLKSLFPEAKAEVYSDLLGAARATLGDESGIACILGTGSNSCAYDGEKITQHVPPLGYILGDEGSGAVLGRKFLADYLRGIMPAGLANDFRKSYPMKYVEFLDRTYKLEFPNRFLAGFVPFLNKNIQHNYVSGLVEDSFNDFVERNIALYPDYLNKKISFCGSVAYFFRDQLKNVCERNYLNTGVILREPIEGLIRYHRI